MTGRLIGKRRRLLGTVLVAALIAIAPMPAHADGVDHLRRGNAALDAGRLAEAAAAYREAARDRGAAPIAWFNLALVLVRQGHAADASGAFARAARLAGDDDRLASRAHYNRGVLLERAGELQESLGAFKDAVRRDPGWQDARINFAIVRARLDRNPPPPPPPAPEDALEQALQQVPAQSYAFTKGVKRQRPAVAASDW